MKNMKKLILIIAIITNYSLTVKSQTPLNLVSDTNSIYHISASPYNYNFSYTNSTEHYFYNKYNDTSTLRRTSLSGFNDITLSNSAINGSTVDTLSVSNSYYGTSDGKIIYNGNNVNNPLNTLPIKSIASCINDTIYAFISFGGFERYIIKIYNDSIIKILDFGSTITSSVQQYYDAYESITYFKYNNVEYLLLIGNFNNTYDYTIFDITNINNSNDILNIINGTSNIENATFSNTEGLFYNISTNIYKLDNINPIVGNEQLDGTLTYNVPTGITINDISSNDLIGNDFRIYAATSDGIYCNVNDFHVTIPSTVGIEEKINFNNVGIYPNPNNGKFTLTNLTEETTITIQNSYGQIIQSYENIGSSTLEVNIDMPAGFYFIRISNKNETQVHKVVIN